MLDAPGSLGISALLPVSRQGPAGQQAPQATVFAATRCRESESEQRGHDPNAWLQSPALPTAGCENVDKLINLSEDGCLCMMGNLTGLS